MSIEAMKIALEALEEPKEHFAKHRRLEAVIALRAAIKQAKPWVKTYAGGKPNYTTPEEQPEQEPVAFCYLRQTSSDQNPPHGWAVFFSKKDGDVPLYTAPRREWQGLTDDEKRLFSSWLDEKSDDAVFRAIEAKLKEKNT